MRRVSGMDCWQRVLYAVAITAVAATIAASSGCGASQRTSMVQQVAAGVRTAHETTNRARDAYVTAQRIAEGAAVDAARAMGGTPDEIEARGLAALRLLDDARRPVLAAFAVAYAALARAESLVALVEAGKRDPMALLLAAQEVARSAEAVYAAVRGGP